MSKAQRTVEMGNLICKFGKKNLLDYFSTVIHPAFFDKKAFRSHGGKKYFFDKVKIITVEGTVLLTGRFIKDIVLEREQVYTQNGGLQEDHKELPSSPSAIFVIVLSVHRVIYFKETKFAPTLENFKATLDNFFKQKHREYIDRLAQASKDSGQRITKKQLLIDHMPPSLDIIPLTSARDIASFVKQYEVLSSVTYKFSDRNDEQDNEGFFRAVQKQKDEVGSTVTTIKHASQKGLEKEVVINEVKAATAQGNQQVVMTGVDSDGNTLRGDNSNFQLKATLQASGQTAGRIARKMYQKFLQLVEDGLIQVPNTPPEVAEKLARYRDPKK